MNQPKYKAWIEDAGVMTDVLGLEWNAEGVKWVTLLDAVKRSYPMAKAYSQYTKKVAGKRVVLRQNTGLKDKNGVEVYEGDILKWSWLPMGKTEPIEHTYSVVFKGGQFRQFEAGDPISGVWKDWGELEVIGDIYRNPDLLQAA